MMGFEIGGLIGDQRVSRRVRFIETVAGELFHQVEQLRGQPFFDVARHCAVDENVALLGHLFGIFLAHRAAQHIRAAQRVAADDLRDLHHLLLIHDHTVSRLERDFQFGMKINRRRFSVLAVDEVFHHARFQRAGTIQRDQRHDVFKGVGLQPLDQIFHTARFQLEYGGGVAGLQQLVSRAVIQRHGF